LCFLNSRESMKNSMVAYTSNYDKKSTKMCVLNFSKETNNKRMFCSNSLKDLFSKWISDEKTLIFLCFSFNCSAYKSETQLHLLHSLYISTKVQNIFYLMPTKRRAECILEEIGIRSCWVHFFILLFSMKL